MKYILCVIMIVSGLWAADTKANVSKKSINENEIGIRKTPVNNENLKLGNISYNAAPAGESKLIERSFENAPPMIPHDVEGMMEITKDNNMCLSCHTPSLAPTLNATAIPESHLYDLRTNKKTSNEMPDDSRYNCNLCHSPQANVKLGISNTFKPDFRDNNSKSKSNLMDTLNEGVK